MIKAIYDHEYINIYMYQNVHSTQYIWKQDAIVKTYIFKNINGYIMFLPLWDVPHVSTIMGCSSCFYHYGMFLMFLPL